MKMNLYCVLDRVANVMMVPFPAMNHGAAIRSFGDGMQDPNGQFSKHPQDYALVHVGTFDDNTGLITGMEGGIASTISSGADWKVAPTIAGAVPVNPEPRRVAIPSKH